MKWLKNASDNITQGTIVENVNWGKDGEDPLLSIVLSNACDLSHGKSSFLLVAALVPANETIQETKEFQDITECERDKGLTTKQKKALRTLLEKYIHNKDISRFFFFDTAPVIDAGLLLVDFQQICSIDRAQIKNIVAVAQLDHPFVEQMMMHFASYTARIPSDRVADAPLENYIKELALKEE